MSDKIKGFVVTLDTDVSDEYAEHIKNAILMMKNVSSVESCVTDINDHMNRQRIVTEMRAKLYKFIQDDIKL